MLEGVEMMKQKARRRKLINIGKSGIWDFFTSLERKCQYEL